MLKFGVVMVLRDKILWIYSKADFHLCLGTVTVLVLHLPSGLDQFHG